jgi:hypothetical protein
VTFATEQIPGIVNSGVAAERANELVAKRAIRATYSRRTSTFHAAVSAGGRYSQNVALSDVAPTLAARLGISLPSAADGRVLSEVSTVTPDAAAH